MSEMVERVARAIFQISPDETVSRPSLMAASRAIAAMREPTMNMQISAVDHMNMQQVTAVRLWHVMIEEALR